MHREKKLKGRSDLDVFYIKELSHFEISQRHAYSLEYAKKYFRYDDGPQQILREIDKVKSQGNFDRIIWLLPDFSEEYSSSTAYTKWILKSEAYEIIEESYQTYGEQMYGVPSRTKKDHLLKEIYGKEEVDLSYWRECVNEFCPKTGVTEYDGVTLDRSKSCDCHQSKGRNLEIPHASWCQTREGDKK